MTPERFLIIHKVRGEPEFDIAYKMKFAEDDGWLIPSIGHRAYPFMSLPLADMGHGFNPDLIIESVLQDRDWADWPDLYRAAEKLRNWRPPDDTTGMG